MSAACFVIFRAAIFSLLLFAVGCGHPLDSSVAGFSAPDSHDALDSGRFIVFAPKARTLGDCEPLPVLLFMHGLGENGENGLTQIHNNFGPEIAMMQEHFPFIAVCVQTSKERLWIPGGEQVKQVLKILDDVIKEYDADGDRVILTGVSSGGGGVWQNAADIPERFAAAVPLSAVVVSRAEVDLQKVVGAGLPLWMILNAGDEKVVDAERERREQLMDLGVSPMVTEYQLSGHNSWGRGYMNPAMFAWCLEQNRARRQARFRWVKRDDLLQSTTQVAGAALTGWEAGEGDSLSSRSDAGGVIPIPVGSQPAEVHFDFWPSPDSVARIGLYQNEAADSPAFVLRLCDFRSGYCSLLGSDGKQIGSIDVTTQHQLTAGEWNDVRLAIDDGGNLQVRVNGWKGDAIPLGESTTGYHFALMPPETGQSTFRYVRYRIGDEGQE